MVIKQRKGQAALEFLTTYGWAFMVILVMIGALAYFGVLNPQQLIPDSCSITSGFTCEEFEVTENSVDISLINNMGGTRELSGGDVNIAGDSIVSGSCGFYSEAGAVDEITDGRIADGGRFFLHCDVDDVQASPGEKARLAFEFDHRRSGGSFDSTASGTITATVRE